MAVKKAAVAKRAKPVRKPVKLNEQQIELVSEAFMEARQAEAAMKERQARLQKLLTMVAPEGSTGFDFKNMAFTFEAPSEQE